MLCYIYSDTDLINDKTLFSDLPPGPLDRYRHIATFDWRKLTLVLEGEKCLRFRVGLTDFYLLYCFHLII